MAPAITLVGQRGIEIALGRKFSKTWAGRFTEFGPLTDWFKSRDSEIKRMLRRMEELLENDPAYQLKKQKANRIEVLQ
jgi:hypothetical protein